MMDSLLISQLEEQGYKTRVVPIHHINDLKEDIDKQYRQGLFNEQFYQESLTSLDFSLPDSLLDVRSLIIVAVPRHQFEVVFTWRGKQVPVLVPSYYLCWRSAEKQLTDSLDKILSPSGYRAIKTALPHKLLVTRSGLGQYGKNNICFVPGMGSFNRLWSFYSDLPCQEDNWQEPQMMASCQNCSACLRKCPTGAITRERFLLHAERCITFHNEQLSEVPFPNWMDPAWHHCLVGCTYCQNICPQNKDFLKRIERGPEFSEEETALLLNGTPLDQLPAAMVEKLDRVDLTGFVGVLTRNLNALVARGADKP